VVVVIFAHVSSLSDEDNARDDDANLFCSLLFLGIVVIDTDVNDEDEEEKGEHICLECG
jgi:hypothetical protein|tara:strand:- start:293 stop:469 length:177 start_codon:yes stop_codon:yes gene_type:complete